MTFRELDLNPIIVRRLAQIGYTTPTPVQSQAAGPILAGRDLIGLAQTGSGKTAAFIAPLAHLLLAKKPTKQVRKSVDAVDTAKRLRTLVLCPTRELAVQVAAEASEIVKGSVLRIASVHGKVSPGPQIKELNRGVDLLVATPGRAIDLLKADALHLGAIEHIVIDEADRMMDMGFLPQVQTILHRCPGKHQTLLFSATMPRPVEELTGELLRKPVRIEVGRHTTTAEHVEQHLVEIDDDLKVPAVMSLLLEYDRRGVVIFCRTRRRVGWVAAALKRGHIATGLLHSNRSHAQRTRALEQFRNGEISVLVATDVAARGLHIQAVRTVINYDLPIEPPEYVHRIGRAGHGGGFGESFSFVSKKDQSRWESIVQTVGVTLQSESIPGIQQPIEINQPEIEDSAGSGKQRKSSTKRSRQRAMRGMGRRTKKSRPIQEGEKPGRGVQKRQRSDKRNPEDTR